MSHSWLGGALAASLAFWLFFNSPLSGGSSLAVLTLAVVLVEQIAARIPSGGFASAAFFLWLVAAFHSELGPSDACWLLLWGLTLRALVRPEKTASTTLGEALKSGLPGLFGLAIFKLVAQSGLLLATSLAALAFLPARWLVQRSVSDQTYRRRLMPLELAATVLAVSCYQGSLFLGLALAFFLQVVFNTVTSVTEARQRTLLELKLQKREENLAESHRQVQSLHQAVRLKGLENEVLQSIGSTVVRAQSFEDGIKALFSLIQRLVGHDEIVFFERPGTKPVRSGPGRVPDRPPSLALEAVRTNAVLFEQLERGGGAAALSQNPLGVLYLVRWSQPLASRDQELLKLVAASAREALVTAYQREQERRAAVRLDLFIEAALCLTRYPEREPLLQKAAEFVPRLVNCSEGGFFEGTAPRRPESVTEEQFLVLQQRESKLGLWVQTVDKLPDHDRRWLSLYLVLVEQSLAGVELQRKIRLAHRDAAIAQIAASLSHELNTPLGTVQLQLGMARRKPGEASAYLDKAQNAVEKAQKILAGLLYFVTPYGLEPEPVDLRALLEGVVKAQRCAFICLEGREGEPPLLSGYPVELEKLFSLLLANSLEAVEGLASPQVRVELDWNDAHLEVFVDDNGAGVDPAIRERIFEPFFSSKEVGEGLGLGLTVASQIALRHGGSLSWIEPRMGGASFRLLLPQNHELLAGVGSA